MKWCMRKFVYVYTDIQSGYPCHTTLFLDIVPKWQQCTTKVAHCPISIIMGVVYVATRYKNHAGWYSIYDNLVSMYNREVY